MKKYSAIISLIILPILQIVLVLIIYEYANNKYPLSKRDPLWGLIIIRGSYLYVGVVISGCIINYFIIHTWKVIVICIIALIIYDFFLLMALESRPLRVPFIIFLTNFAQILTLTIGHFLSKRKIILNVDSKHDKEILDR